jgi:rhamnose utilization protein RhaD (predicted bifunctional aldolase and dehydrogenase)
LGTFWAVSDHAVPDELVSLTRFLGDPAQEIAILAEGNASAMADENSFWVKASGFSMRDIEARGFVRVRFAEIREALASDSARDEEVRAILESSRADETPLMPSVETFMHAYLLSLPGVSFVGHGHPTPLLSLLCLEGADQLAKQRLFPDEIVCCGPAAAFVPYVDPGLPLARAIRNSVEKYVAEQGSVPKTIWLENHGLIALGRSPREIESAMCMSVKAAKVWLGAYASGRPIKALTSEQVARIRTRPDEHYRQRLLWELRGSAG